MPNQELNPIVTEQSLGKKHSRRNFIKWGVVGGLIALPIGLSVYRKIRGNGYEYVLKGPFQIDEDLDQYRKYHFFRQNDWAGTPRSHAYTPDIASLDTVDLNDPNAKVTFGATFSIKNDVPADFGAIVRIAVKSHSEILINKIIRWNVPHKKPGITIRELYGTDECDEAKFSPRPFEYAHISFPLKLLSEIDSIVFLISEYFCSNN